MGVHPGILPNGPGFLSLSLVRRPRRTGAWVSVASPTQKAAKDEMRGNPVLFEDTFEVLERDPDGKKFDRVSRYRCKSDLFEMDLTIDIHVEVYPLDVGQKFRMALASTLNPDGKPDEGNFDQTLQWEGHPGRPSLMDDYEYVMYGKLFKFGDDHSTGTPKVEVYVSFGGLLMLLKGDPKKLEELEINSRLYLLVRKV